MENFKNYIVSENITIRKALQLIERNEEKCLFAIDGKEILKGSLTDGDIRRAILKRLALTQNKKVFK